MEESEPLWRRIFFNELVLVSLAACVILYIAFRLATGGETLDDAGKPLPAAKP